MECTSPFFLVILDIVNSQFVLSMYRNIRVTNMIRVGEKFVTISVFINFVKKKNYINQTFILKFRLKYIFYPLTFIWINCII